MKYRFVMAKTHLQYQSWKTENKDKRAYYLHTPDQLRGIAGKDIEIIVLSLFTRRMREMLALAERRGCIIRYE